MLDERTASALLMLEKTTSFMIASERLKISQPTLTRLIQKAEAENRIEIFERSSAGVRPTSVGKRFLDLCREYQVFSKEFDVRAKKIATGTEQIKLLCGPLGAQSVVPAALLALHQEYPYLQQIVTVSGKAEHMDTLFDDHIDLFIGALTHTTSMLGLDITILDKKEIVFVAHPSHPIFKLGEIPFGRIFDFPIASAHIHKHYQKLISDALVAVNQEVEWPMVPSIETDDFALLVELAQTGGFITAGVFECFAESIEAGSLKVVPAKEPPHWNICIAKHTGKNSDPTEFLWNLLVDGAV